MSKKKIYPPPAPQEPQMQSFNADASLNYLSQKLAASEKQLAMQIGLVSSLQQENAELKKKLEPEEATENKEEAK